MPSPTLERHWYESDLRVALSEAKGLCTAFESNYSAIVKKYRILVSP